MSAFVERFEHDVFVSYAHLDDVPLGSGDMQWITSLVRYLREELVSNLGRADIWHDLRLAGNDALWPELASRLKRSAILLAVVTPAYISSPWCRRELTTFLEYHQDAPAGSRIVHASKDPLDEFPLPDGLASAQVWRFYHWHAECGQVVRLLPGQEMFQIQLEALAVYITSVLRALKQPGATAVGKDWVDH